MPLDPQAFADVIVLAIKTAQAPLLARLDKLEAVPVPAAVAELPSADLAASLAGLLRQELLADLPMTKSTRKTVRDAQGVVKFEIEETR